MNNTINKPAKLKLAIIGYGKMGKAVEEIALQRGHEIILRINAANAEELSAKNLEACDVAIEFTSPHSAVKNIYTCVDKAIPVICGSTGWLDQWQQVKDYCLHNNGSLLYASNFSIGVNIFFEINKKLAALMAWQNDYEVSIEETHHTQKKDSPSGTAITLAEDILKALPRKTSWVKNNSFKNEELTISSKRIDPVAGTHVVKYASAVDDIEIIHTAHNRHGFASGAVLAAEFIYGKKGIFTMKDVLGLNEIS